MVKPVLIESAWGLNQTVKQAGEILGFFPEARSLFFADDSSAPVAPSFDGWWKEPPPGCEARMRMTVPIQEIVRLAQRMDALFPPPATFFNGGIELDGQGFHAPRSKHSATVYRKHGKHQDERSMEIGVFMISMETSTELLNIANAYARWGFHLISARARAGGLLTRKA
jgi:hypothetical protein